MNSAERPINEDEVILMSEARVDMTEYDWAALTADEYSEVMATTGHMAAHRFDYLGKSYARHIQLIVQDAHAREAQVIADRVACRRIKRLSEGFIVLGGILIAIVLVIAVLRHFGGIQ